MTILYIKLIPAEMSNYSFYLTSGVRDELLKMTYQSLSTHGIIKNTDSKIENKSNLW